MAIRDWSAGERPREKLLQKGAQALSEAELLAIFLRTGVKGKSAWTSEPVPGILRKRSGMIRDVLDGDVGGCARLVRDPEREAVATLEALRRRVPERAGG